MPTHILRFKEELQEKNKSRNGVDGKPRKVKPSFVTGCMIRLKTYIKRLSEKGYLDKLSPAEIPINSGFLRTPSYLTKQEIKQLVNYLERWVQVAEALRRKRDHRYKAYMGRALVRMLYAT